MAEVHDLSTHRPTGAMSAAGSIAPSDAAEKASLRFVASLLTFGPTATGKSLDLPDRRRVRRSMRAPS